MKPVLSALLLLGIIGLWYFYPKTEILGDASGANSPGTMADDATVGDTVWTNPDNAKVSDNVYATVILAAAERSHYLKATNFSFSIPVGATIDGVVVENECKNTSGSNGWDIVKLVKGGVIGGTNHRPTMTATEAYVSTGSSSDLWGLTLSPTDVNASDFGVVFQDDGPGGGTTISVDHIRITITYTPVSGFPQVQVRSGTINVRSGSIIVK